MHGDLGLLINLSVSLVLALGLITQRLRLSPIVGYLLAGVARHLAKQPRDDELAASDHNESSAHTLASKTATTAACMNVIRDIRLTPVGRDRAEE